VTPIIDAHAHIFPLEFPIPEGPGNKPEPYERTNIVDFREVLRAQGVSHGLLVQPSGYLFDNTALLDGIARSGGTVRGIGVVPYSISDSELADLQARGMVGHRFNAVDLSPGEFEKPEAVRFLDRLREIGWIAEIHVFASDLPTIAPALERSRARLMFDHLGRPDVRRGVYEPGFARFLEFGRSGQGFAKLTCAIRVSQEAFPFFDVDPYVAAILEAYTPQRCVWGSDWPFVLLKRGITYAQVQAWFERVVPDEKARRAIQWETPATAFGFAYAMERT
jgi:predicted TIM-barrel fold metal-dependent hydrolase